MRPVTRRRKRVTKRERKREGGKRRDGCRESAEARRAGGQAEMKAESQTVS